MSSPIVTWLRAPASSPNVLLRPNEKSGLARITLPQLLFVAFALVALAIIWTFETYTVHERLGDDGVIYAAVIRAYDGHVQHLGLNGYTSQRVLSPLSVRVALDLLHVPTTSAAIVAAYKVENSIAIITAIGSCILTALHFRLSRAGLLFAVLTSYVNFCTLYWLPFDPVLTDGMALAIGALQLWAYVARRYVVLAIVSAIGGFIWPGTTQVGAALLFFARPPRSEDEVPSAPQPRDPPSWLDLSIAAALTALLTWYAASLASYGPGFHQKPAVQSLFRLACALLCILTFFALKELIRVGPSLRQLIRRDRDALLAKLLAVVMLFAVSHALRWVAAAPTTLINQAPDYPLSYVLSGTVYFSVQRPAIHVAAHAGFYGPAIMILIVCWREVTAAARRLGFGLLAAFGLAYFFLLNSQSRGAINCVPIVLPLVVLGAARLPWTPRRLFELGLMTVFATKLWWTVVQKPTIDYQTLFEHIGPWMSNDAYVAHGLCALLIVAWLVWMKQQKPADVVWLSEAQPEAD